MNSVPKVDKFFVPWGHYDDIRTIIESKKFFPAMITGLSGNGKTLSVEQACAQTKRELIRCNITIETDEDDLLGGFRLENDHTVWHNGPVIEAMERGAVLLLDECDLAGNKIMCLQPVLEGKGIFLKKINKFVSPQPGFTIFGTANTKGQGDDTGKFIGTNILNEAFMERFALTFEQAYPPAEIEEKILKHHIGAVKTSKSFIPNLVRWANENRLTFHNSGFDEIITTRRLVHIINAFQLMNGNIKKTINLCLSRFSDESKAALTDSYRAIEEKYDDDNNEKDVRAKKEMEEPKPVEDDECPF